jgi:hypothetical protein
MRRFLFLLLLLAPVFVVVITTPACDDGPVPRECSDIPKGGCPLQHGVSCSDPQCESVYLCRPNNVWELHEVCPPHEGGLKPDAASSSDAPTNNTSFDASIDAPPGAFGGPGCDSLQAPECSLGLALSCGGASCCGCEDLFVCENGGWTLWGVCSTDGGIQRF